ncbi:MAG: type III pantothenate kinase [Paludibacteraceae bacterium]|nr:type III pantothenate kinase [Paludibacteraceae bacterium]
MNLCIDQGNSRTKVALFAADGRLVKTFVYKSFTSSDVERLFSLYPLHNSIVSSVINIEPSMVNALQRLSQHFVLFDHYTPVPIVNDYESPDTLGLDRLAAAVGAVAMCPNKDLLIIDAGSAITYDVVTANGHYLGGNIAPGLKMRFYALHHRTKKLPMVDVSENSLIPLFGKNTHDAIVAGVVRGVAFEVKGYIRALQTQGTEPTVMLTGGHAPYILQQVQSPMCHEKNLVLIGLNTILNTVKKS